MSGGTNNAVWRVETADKQYYVLHLFYDLSRISHIHYEAALLEALANRQPSFSLPIPLKAQNGDIVVLFEQETGIQVCAVLTHLLPGSTLDRNDLSLAAHGGVTFVEHFPLDEAELLAFPDIWRLRDSASFVHRMGRYMAGLETEAHIQKRVQHSLWREAWLLANQDTLVLHALRWGKNERLKQ